jgi:microsomal dipeptidase-like Zn-dependent dipeptidase
MRFGVRAAIVSGTGAVVVLALASFFWLVPDLAARRMNPVTASGRGSADVRTATVDGEPFIADLHADSLLWSRDLGAWGRFGHVDIPRMLAAGHGLQVFSAVTQSPRGLNFERNGARSDNITLLAVAQRWPVATWTSRTARALYQAERLRRLERALPGKFFIIESGSDLRDYLARRDAGEAVTAGLLAIEGLHALDDDLVNLERLYAAGYRMMGLTHFFDNALGGSAHGMDKGGLTPFGAEVVRRMEQLHVIVDLAHASPRLMADVLAVATRPVVVSHTGVRGTCDNSRNLSDVQLDAVRANRGLVGIAFFRQAVCGDDLRAIAVAIRYAATRIGIESVALGSDFDGAVATPIDVTGVRRIADALADEGFGSGDIAAIMGQNAVRFFMESLPSGSGGSPGPATD